MPYREFHDPDGAVWNVWDVVPTLMDALLAAGRGEPRSMSPRTVEQSLSKGWLCFQHGEQKRRLAPIPDDWERLPEQSLQLLLSVAVNVAAHRATERSSSMGQSESTL